LRWLGAAGLELRVADEILLIDPYVTRVPFRRLWRGRVQPDQALIAQTLPQARYVLVTHAHFDHLMDVPEVLRITGATAYGSPNTCALLGVCGAPQGQIRRIALGDRLTLGDYSVRALPAEHMPAPGFGPGPLRPALAPPLRARDYAMDGTCCYWVSVGGWNVLADPGGLAQPDAPVDILCVGPHREPAYYAGLAARLRPRVVIPIHWDDLFRPLSQPLRPYRRPPGWPGMPFQRLDLDRFRRAVEQAAPGVRVLTIEALRPYALVELMGEQDDARA
jgi:L-ascorbate metabolism protein UlaG (beta-lactamase superfamily)